MNAPVTMDVTDIRHRNLMALIEQVGGRPAFCEITGLNDGYLSLVINRKPSSTGKPRSLGTSSARKIEEKIGKPFGWMDSPHDESENDDAALLKKTYMRQDMAPEILQGDRVSIDPRISFDRIGIKIAAFETAHGLRLGRSSPGPRTLLYTPGAPDPVDITEDAPKYIGCVVEARRTY